MLNQSEIAGIRALLLSDRITYKGSEIGTLSQILAALQREENAGRIQPRTPKQDATSAPVPVGSEGTTEE
jgi:hypothetical protein